MARRTTQTAVVTGGTRGLGRALVLAFAERGYRVYTMARSPGSLRALAEEAAAADLPVVTVRGDVAREKDNSRLVRRLAEDRRRVDVVIHNAGLLGPRVELERYPRDAFEAVVAVNLVGPFDLTRQILPRLRPGAAIQFVTSGAGLAPRTGWGAYNVSKIALEGLAGIYAQELGPRGFRVFLVDPGPMRTAMRAAAYPEEDPATLDRPERRVGAFLWLAREAPPSLNGGRFEAYRFGPGRGR